MLVRIGINRRGPKLLYSAELPKLDKKLMPISVLGVRKLEHI